MFRIMALTTGLLTWSGAAAISQDTTADVEAIKALHAEWNKAMNAGDFDGMMATVADDAIFMMDGAPAVFGKATIEARGRPWFRQYEGDEVVTDEEVVVTGDWAFLRGTGTGTLRPKAGGEAIPIRSKAIFILKRQTDGSWKFWRLVANSDIPKRCP